jgi:mannose-1-phosphate guanylyltransferase
MASHVHLYKHTYGPYASCFVTGGIHIRGVILAAGAGERARPLTEVLPKALLYAAGKTLLDWSLHDLRHAGVQDITAAVGFMASMVEDHINSETQEKGYDQSPTIVDVQDYEIGPLRTALTAFESFSDEEFIVTPVDAVVGTEVIKGMLNKHKETRQMILAVDFTANSGTLVHADKDGLIVRLGNSTPSGASSVGRSAMLLIAHRSIVEYCKSALSRGESRLVPVLNQMIDDGIPILSYDIRSKWFDIDTLHDLLLLNLYLLESRAMRDIAGCIYVPKGDLMEIGDKLVLRDSDVVVNKNVLVKGPVLLLPGCAIEQGCSIGPNVTVGPYARISERCELANTIVYSKSLLSAHCRVHDAIVYGSEIYSEEM